MCSISLYGTAASRTFLFWRTRETRYDGCKYCEGSLVAVRFMRPQSKKPRLPVRSGVGSICLSSMARHIKETGYFLRPTFGEKVIFNGYEKWPNDVEKCTRGRVGNIKGSGCGVCVAVCPWNKPFTPFHRFIQWTMRNIPPARRFAVWGDDLLGYGQPNTKNKWWLDLEDVDGKLTIPTQAGQRGNHKPR